MRKLEKAILRQKVAVEDRRQKVQTEEAKEDGVDVLSYDIEDRISRIDDVVREVLIER